jgi:[acyl-carrier-protein] S-malonyltransferase
MKALLFPGQGSQKRGMGSQFYDDFGDLFDQASNILGYSLKEICSTNPSNLLSKTEYAQPAIYFVNALHARKYLVLDGHNVDYVAGHSLGEYNALLAAGVIELLEGLSMVRERALVMSRVAGGGMSAIVGLDGEKIDAILHDCKLNRVYVANYNSDSQVIISGDREQLALVAAPLKAAGAQHVLPLNVSGPFHSPLMQDAAAQFTTCVKNMTLQPPRLRIVSSVSGDLVRDEEIRDLLIAQICAPVEWVKLARTLRRCHVTDYHEVGGESLVKLIGDVA